MTKKSSSENYFQDSEFLKGTFRFGGTRATSQAVVWPILVLLSLNISSMGISEGQESRLYVLRVVFAALVCAGLYFTIVGWFINVVAPQRRLLRTALVAFLYASTEVVRAVLVLVFAQMLGLHTIPQWSFRVFAAATTGLLIFALMSTVLNDTDAYRKVYSNYYTRQIQLRSVVNASLENVIRARDQLVQTTQTLLSQALKSTLQDAENKSPSYQGIIDSLFSVAENIVRPLSHSLYEQSVQSEPADISVIAPRVSWRVIVQKSTVTEPFRPGLLIVIALLLSAPAVFSEFTVIFFLTWAGILVAIYLTQYLAQKYITPRLPSIPFVLRLLIIYVLYALSSVLLVQFLMSETINNQALFGESIIYGSVLGMVLGWLVASSAGLRSARLEVIEQIAEINNQLVWQNARLQAELWLDQKSLALTLHNDVQASLLAAALKLKASVEIGETAAQDELPEIRKLISRSINFTTSSTRVHTLDAVVTRINENWGGLITMKYTASGETLSRIEEDPVVLGVLEDVLSEFQNNSLKHGQASDTTAILTMPSDSIVQVAMSNNGHKIESTSQAGLGSALMKSVSTDFKFENFTRGVSLTVKLPLSSESSR